MSVVAACSTKYANEDEAAIPHMKLAGLTDKNRG